MIELLIIALEILLLAGLVKWAIELYQEGKMLDRAMKRGGGCARTIYIDCPQIKDNYLTLSEQKWRKLDIRLNGH